MTEQLPRIDSVAVAGPTELRVRWRGTKTSSTVDLAGWIKTGGAFLAPLADPGTFKRAAIVNYGAAIGWDDGDLAIDAFHLKQIADEQTQFGPAELAAWQEATGVSNKEAAKLLGVGLSTWNAYKAGDSRISTPLAMLLRAIKRDPLVLQAHLRPSAPAGRPRKVAKRA